MEGSVDLEWPCSQENYVGVDNVTRKLGQGAFSTVYHGRCLSNDREVAIKVMDLENVTSSFEDILLEVQTMKLSNHENILKLYVSFVAGSKLWLVLEYMDKGSCLRILNIAKKMGMGEGFNESWVAYLIRETLKGLDYLHNAGYIHRDIKPGNILVNSNGEVRLADFGVTGWILSRGQRHDNVRTFVGTLCYMSPEIMEQTSGYDQRADIWSLGITTLELAKGFAPYAKYAAMRVLVMTIEEDPPSLRSYADDLQRTGQPFSKYFEDFCSKCLRKDAKSRASADELLKHKFLRGRSKESIVEELLNQIPPIDDNSNADTSTTQEGRIHVASEPVQSSSHQSKYVAGTTWVFDDETRPSNEKSEGSIVYKKSGVYRSDSTSRGKMLNVSVLRGTSSGGQAIVRITNEPEKDIDEFLDDFEIESASMKLNDQQTISRQKKDVHTTDTSMFLDEFQGIIGKDEGV